MIGGLLIGPGGLPELSARTQDAIVFLYGLLLAGVILTAVPHARRFFLSERHGGYAESSRRVDAVQNPVVLPLLLAVWLACAVSIATGVGTVWAALVNVLICHELFISMRWRGVLRGMGAPGFVTYWVGVAVFLLVLTSRYAPSAHALALLVLQVDFALILLSAGLYKLVAGYRQNYGVDLGLANPEWGYWWQLYRRLPGDHPVLRLLNQLGWATEIGAAVLMLVPQTRFLGGALVVVVFAVIATQIRLGLLCELVVLDGLLYLHPGSLGDKVVERLPAWVPSAPAAAHVGWLASLLTVLLWTYLALLPLAQAGLFVNLYGRRSLPGALQRALERYTNLFGIIVWRVFSVDVVSFFVLVSLASREAPQDRRLLSRFGWRHGLRYSHVGEMITITSLFTTLVYYPSNRALFEERLLRYARTVSCPEGSVVVFELVRIEKGREGFVFTPAAEYVVDLAAGSVAERLLAVGSSPRERHRYSRVVEGERPGSYAPRAG